ncbi:hypothetical protein MalM25_34970 [Planctomycetes bacterium MalM25]|nr:hypothetical protein MalM25_34970 [Planctomycetes bacterium MalM25]
MVSADIYETPGLPGYQTYDLSLKVDEGAFITLTFDPAVGGGISGPLHQSPGFMGTASQVFDGGLDDGNLADSRFLMRPGSENLVFNDDESESHLSTVYGTFGPHLDYTVSEVPLARLVTNAPADIQVLGSVGISPSPTSRPETHRVDFKLSDFSIDQAPLPIDVPGAQRAAAAEEYRRKMAEAQLTPEPPVAEPTEPVNPDPQPEPPAATPQEPTNPTVTLEAYQQGLDEKASAILARMEQLNSSLSEVIELRTASEQPGFQLPTTPVSLPGVSTPSFSIVYTDHQIAIDAIQIDPIELRLFEVNDFVATTTVFDADAVWARSTLDLSAVQSNAFALHATAPEPGGLAMLVVAIAGLASRSRSSTRR